MYDLITIGDIKLDVFIDLGNDAKLNCNLNTDDCRMEMDYGRKIPIDSAVTMMAGSAPNVAIGARRLGSTSSIISVVGNDATEALARQGLKKEGISDEYITVVDGAQSSFSAILNFKGESTVLAMHRPHTFVLPDRLSASWIFVTELGPKYPELYTELIARKQEGYKIGINPGTLQIEENKPILKELIANADLLLLNKTEAADLTGSPTDDIEALLASAKELGCPTVIITDGKKGAWATKDEDTYHAPMFPGERVEATGAGDAFSTGVLSALVQEQSLATALAWGSVNAASVVQYIGPQEGLLTHAQIADFLKNTPDYSVTTL